MYDLSITSSSGNAGTVGIYYTGPVTGTNIVESNFVHSFSLATSAVAGFMYGIYAGAGVTTYRNNMVRLGIKADGTSVSTGYSIYGMNEINGGSSVNNFYHNSIYIGGTCTPSASKTYAFYSSFNQPAVRDFYNNILYNARSNSSTAGGGRHYACQFLNITNLSCDYNDIIATGTDKMLAYYTADRSTLDLWRTATGKDASSISSDPKYIAPTDPSSSADLHINGSAYTLVEGGGTPVASVTTDYDAQSRASYTATDLGADAITNVATAERRRDPDAT